MKINFLFDGVSQSDSRCIIAKIMQVYDNTYRNEYTCTRKDTDMNICVYICI